MCLRLVGKSRLGGDETKADRAVARRVDLVASRDPAQTMNTNYAANMPWGKSRDPKIAHELPPEEVDASESYKAFGRGTEAGRILYSVRGLNCGPDTDIILSSTHTDCRRKSL